MSIIVNKDNVEQIIVNNKTVERILIGSEVIYSATEKEAGFYNNINELIYTWEQLKARYPGVVTDSSIEYSGDTSILAELSGYFVIADTVTELKHGAFSNCINLTKVYLNNVETVGDFCFYNCESLTKVLNQKELKVIGYAAFQSCTNLRSFICGDNVRRIEQAFSYCTNLETFLLSDSVESVAMGGNNWPVFNNLLLENNTYYLPSKTNPYYCIYGTTNPASNFCSNLNDNACIFNRYWCRIPNSGSGITFMNYFLKVPANIKSFSEDVSDCPDTLSNVFPDFVSNSPKYTVTNGALVKVADNSLIRLANKNGALIPTNISLIRSRSCSSCYLSNIFPDHFTGNPVLAESALQSVGYSNNNISIIIPPEITSIPDQCFNQSRITRLHIPASVTTVGSKILNWAVCDTSDTILVTCEAQSKPSGWSNDWADDASDTLDIVWDIEYKKPGVYNYDNDNLIYDWAQFKSAYSSYIGSDRIYGSNSDSYVCAFNNISGNIYIVLDDSITTINDRAFKGCANLKKIYLNNTQTIGYNSFKDCTALISVLNQIKLSSTQYGCFENCTSLTSFTCGDKLNILGDSMFINSGLNTFIFNDIIEKASFATNGNNVLTNTLLENHLYYLPSKTNPYYCVYAADDSGSRQTAVINDNACILNTGWYRVLNSSGWDNSRFISMNIPRDIKSLGETTTYSSSSIYNLMLESITSNSSKYEIRGDSLVKVADDSLIRLLPKDSAVIDPSVKIILGSSCMNCTSKLLPDAFNSNVTLCPNCFSNVGRNNNRIPKIVIPRQVTSIPANCFSGYIQTIFIPNTVTYVGRTFYNSNNTSIYGVINCEAYSRPRDWDDNALWPGSSYIYSHIINWGVPAPLPDGYTYLKTLNSDGNQYIDTGYYHSNDSSYKIRFATVDNQSIVSDTAIFGQTTLDNTSSDAHYLMFTDISSSKFNFTYTWYPDSKSSYPDDEFNKTLGKYFQCGLDKSSTWISQYRGWEDASKDSFQPSLEGSSSISSSPDYLFGMNKGSTASNLGAYEIMCFGAFDNQVPKCYLFACKRDSDNVLGMYDVVNNVFLENQGSGSFTGTAL